MKIILKTVLYVVIILSFSIATGESERSEPNSASRRPPLSEDKIEVKTMPYNTETYVKVRNPVFRQRVALDFNSE